jgi:hypothetical protein
MHRTLLFSLAMLTLAARPAAAGPSAQFRIDPLPGAKIQGLSDKESRAFFSGVEALSAHLAAMPAINAPAAPVCIALQREVFRYPMTAKQAEGKINVSYLVKGLFRYLVVEALDGRHSTEQEHNFRHRTELVKQFDFSALAGVFRAVGK